MRFSLLLLICLLTLPLAAQNTRATKTTYDKDGFAALSLGIDADHDEVEDKWDDFWDDRYEIDIDKLDKDRNSIAYKAEQVILPLVSTKAIDVYSKVEELSDTESRVYLTFAFSSADVVTERNHPQSYRAAQAILEEFRTYFYTSYFDEQMADVRKDLDDMRDDSTDDSEDAQKARKKIDKYEKKIADMQRKIEDLREEVGDELESAEEKAERARALEGRLRDLETRRARYLRM